MISNKSYVFRIHDHQCVPFFPDNLVKMVAVMVKKDSFRMRLYFTGFPDGDSDNDQNTMIKNIVFGKPKKACTLFLPYSFPVCPVNVAPGCTNLVIVSMKSVISFLEKHSIIEDVCFIH